MRGPMRKKKKRRRKRERKRGKTIHFGREKDNPRKCDNELKASTRNQRGS